MDFHTTSVHVARKRHTCDVTKLPINPGDRYVRHVGVYEGDFYCARMLAQAAPVYERLNTEAWRRGDEGVVFDNLVAELVERLENEPTHVDVRDASLLISLYVVEHPQQQWLREALDGAVEEMNNRPA